MGPLILAATFLLMYVLFILPQKRRMRAHQAVLAQLEVGDDIITSAGIYGRVTAADDESLRVEVAPGVELRMARGAVARVVATDDSRPDSRLDSRLDSAEGDRLDDAPGADQYGDDTDKLR